jgi:hypothetical protein
MVSLIKKGFNMGKLHLVKTAASGDQGKRAISTARNAAEIVGSVGLATGGVMLADKIVGAASEQMYKAKIPSLRRYAIKKHPELKEVGEKKLERWFLALFSLAPKIANDQELAADSLYQIYQYGGNFDMATAKILSDINKGTKDNNLPFITTGNQIRK